MHEHLLQRAQMLAMRLAHLGIGQDLAGLTLADLWGVYRFMQRLANA